MTSDRPILCATETSLIQRPISHCSKLDKSFSSLPNIVPRMKAKTIAAVVLLIALYILGLIQKVIVVWKVVKYLFSFLCILHFYVGSDVFLDDVLCCFMISEVALMEYIFQKVRSIDTHRNEYLLCLDLKCNFA